MSTSGSGGKWQEGLDIQLPPGKPSVTLQLTDRQARLLVEMVDHYGEGIKDAITATTEDRSLEGIDDLLELTGGYAAALFDLKEMRKQLS
jgi:hypothetical protein